MGKGCQADYIPIFICILSIVNLGLLIAEVAYASHWYEHIHPYWRYSNNYDTATVEKYLIVFITFACVTILGTLIFPRFFAYSSNVRTKIKIAEFGSIYIATGVIVCVFGFLTYKKTSSKEKCIEIEERLNYDGLHGVGKWTIERHEKYLKYMSKYPNYYAEFCYKRSGRMERILIAFTTVLGIMAFLLLFVPIAYIANNDAFVQQ